MYTRTESNTFLPALYINTANCNTSVIHLCRLSSSHQGCNYYYNMVHYACVLIVTGVLSKCFYDDDDDKLFK